MSRRRGRPWAGALIVALAAMLLPVSASARASCARSQHPGGEWRSYNHDLSNTRTQPDEKTIGLAEAATLQPVWQFDTENGDDVSGTPVIADGCLYFGGIGGLVFALNADTGELVWKSKVKGGVNSSVAVEDGKIYATTSRTSKPGVAALDQATGRVLWEVQIDDQPGSDVYASPVYFDDMVFSGWSGGSAELGDEADRYAFQGGFVVLDADTGRLLKKTYSIRQPDENPEKPKDDFAGGAIWATPAIDEKTGFAYVGAGNPFRPQAEHKHTNAILKIDLNRGSSTFGEIVDSYKGTPDEYVPGWDQLPCFDIPGNPAPYYPQGIGECGDLDMDFGSSPNLFKVDGKTMLGEGQKSGIYHVVDAGTMKREWTQIVGPPSAVGGIVGSTAYDDGAVFGPITVGGYLWSLDGASGTPRWFAESVDGAHWANPVTVANGVVYTSDLKGFLNAYDAATGLQVLATPMWIAGEGLKATWGGVSVARNTVYAAIGTLGTNGQVVAYRPAG
ncbi:MAG TPA: PQQ-binding-like beta-propeller repeat protein [Actinomycetota bacterium]|nr:PQQ-binding-like beta-propeller repeat protein [Actinomycetota bacterium]